MSEMDMSSIVVSSLLDRFSYVRDGYEQHCGQYPVR